MWRRRREASVNSLEESVRDGEEGMQVSQKREVRWEELIKERRAECEQVAWRLVCTIDSVAAVRWY
jgi:hypothetical protein